MTTPIYADEELDSEWARYIASLNAQSDLKTKKKIEKRKIVRKERQTMINLQKHLRSLSRARIELEDAASDDFEEDSSSESDTGTVNVIGTPISTRLKDLEPCSDLDDLALPAQASPIKSVPKRLSHAKRRSASLKPIIVHNECDSDPYNVKPGDSETNYDSQDSELNDSHCLNELSDSVPSSPKSASSKSSTTSSSEEQQTIQTLQNDLELAALKEELNRFKRRNFDRLRRTKSQEEVLLSVLNIDGAAIDKKQLQKCTQKAIRKYNTLSVGGKIKSISPLPQSKSNTKQRHKIRTTRLADPYEEEWNGLDPDNYVWYDNMAEGQCHDDQELSLRNRRVQYLVVMAIENNYCSIADLTYKQNELLLMHQQSLKF